MLYPIKLKKIFKEKVWGGDNIKNLKKKHKIPEKCGECWEISPIEKNVSIIKNGFLKNTTIEEAIEIYMGDLVGETIYNRFGNYFPLLVKIIDANENLSIQVHPDNRIAMERYGELGKSELWFVLSTKTDSEIISGFKNNSSAEEFHHALHNGNPDYLLNKINPIKEDVYYIPAGRVHSLGAGISVLEIQQASDITYRLYDYDRTDRELHHEEAEDVIDYYKTNYPKTEYTRNVNAANPIVETEAFNVNFIPFIDNFTRDYFSLDSFVLLYSVNIPFSIEYNGNIEEVEANELVLIPAALNEIILKANGLCKIIEVYIDINPDENSQW